MNGYLSLGPDGRVTDREGKTLELKRDLGSPTGPLRTIVAFANSAGGRLVACVEDDGSVVGVADPSPRRSASPTSSATRSLPSSFPPLIS